MTTNTETTKRKKTATEKTDEAIHCLRLAAKMHFATNREFAIFLDDKAKEIDAEAKK